MDPNTALNALRAATADAQCEMDGDTDHPSFCVVSNRTVGQIIESFTALNEWLSNGGFLPTEWQGQGLCKAFLACERPATTTVSAGPIGRVPACQPCADKLGRHAERDYLD